MLLVKENSVKDGFDHIETIAALHFHKPPQEQMEATSLVMESFGMDEEAKVALIKALDEFVPERLQQARGWVMMGFLAGLSAAQNGLESE
jgi:hypothetical protein